MPTSIRNRLMTTAMVLTPFLLGACDNNSGTNTGPGQFEIVVFAPLLYIAFVAHDWLRKRRSDRAISLALV